MTAEEDHLIAAALSAGEQEYLPALAALVERGGPRIEAAAVVLTQDPVPQVRIVGVDLVVDLGLNNTPLWITTGVPAIAALIERETEPEVLSRAVDATATYFDARFLVPVLRHAAHPDPDVRRSVAAALPFVAAREEPGFDAAVDALIVLTRDPVPTVRDWSTMALGSMIEADSPEIRAALLERVTDEDRDTSAEARAGLARRHDPRAFALVKAGLEDRDGGSRDVASARVLADPRLHGLLVSLRGDWSREQIGSELEAAIIACDPNLQADAVALGSKLLEVAERRKPGLNLRLYCDFFDSVEVNILGGSDVAGWYYLSDIEQHFGGDVDAVVAAMAVDLDHDPDIDLG